MKKANNERVGIFMDGPNVYHGLKGRRIDYLDLVEHFAKGRKIVGVWYFNAYPDMDSPIQTFFKYLGHIGFHVHTRPTCRNAATNVWKQKGMDILLAVEAMKHKEEFDTFILFSGDRDFMPIVEEMVKEGKKIEIVSFAECLHNAYNVYDHSTLDKYVQEYSKEKE